MVGLEGAGPAGTQDAAETSVPTAVERERTGSARLSTCSVVQLQPVITGAKGSNW